MIRLRGAFLCRLFSVRHCHLLMSLCDFLRHKNNSSDMSIGNTCRRNWTLFPQKTYMVSCLPLNYRKYKLKIARLHRLSCKFIVSPNLQRRRSSLKYNISVTYYWLFSPECGTKLAFFPTIFYIGLSKYHTIRMV